MVARMRKVAPAPDSVSRMYSRRCTMTPAELAANTLLLAATDPRLLLECRSKEHAAALRVERNIKKAERFKREVAFAYRAMSPQPFFLFSHHEEEAPVVDTNKAKGS